MSFTAQTYQVMIASPSDLAEERQAATDAVNEWNALHAATNSIVLLPVKWETHATPQTGRRPQEAINQQLVRTSDILIGMFWTKIGTSTGVAESGTVEEINKFVKEDKPALLYFSSRPINPNKINLTQLKKLKEFESSTYKTALVGSFSGVDELRHKLVRDLTRQVQKMKPRGLPPSSPGRANVPMSLELVSAAPFDIQVSPELNNELIRCSISGLFRIEVNGLFLLIQGHRLRHQFQPVGGVFKRYQTAKRFLSDLGVLDDDKIRVDDDNRDDLRIRVPAPRLIEFLQ